MNALRSFARYVALALPDFDVDIAPTDAQGIDRPAVRVRPVTPMATTARGASHREHVQTFEATAYPVAGLNSLSSLIEADRIERTLRDALTIGLDQAGTSRQGGPRTHPMRMPLLDYSDLPLYEPAGDERRIGYARLLDVSADTFPVEADELLYVVGVRTRMAWSESIARQPVGPTVTAVHPKPAQIVGGVTTGPGA